MIVEMHKSRFWKRSTHGILAGVCEGMADSLKVDAWLVRLFWILSIALFGTGLALYIIMALVLPREDQILEYRNDKILGVCRRISERSGVELGLIRLVTVLLAIGSFGLTTLVYLGLYFFMPDSKQQIHFS